jgi:hypothetical protein
MFHDALTAFSNIFDIHHLPRFHHHYLRTQPIIYGDVRMVPLPPTITSCVPDQVTPNKGLVLSQACWVHVIPLGEVRIVAKLSPPTTTNCVPDQATPDRKSIVPEVPEVCTVHITPLGEVRMVPEDPTATNSVPDQATPPNSLEV